MKVIDEGKLESVLNYIKTYQMKRGESPSYRNIMNAQNFKSLSSVYRYVELLIKRGDLKKNALGAIDISDNLAIDQAVIAPIVGVVTCGSPILAQENIEGTIMLPSSIFGSGEMFLLHAEGDSMIEAGVHSGDLLVVKKCSTAENGQIVVALIEDSATVKTFYRKKDHIVLHPENPSYDDIITRDVKILGIVQHCIHKL